MHAISFSNSWEKPKVKKKTNSYQLEMIFLHRIHDFLFEKQFMQWIQGNSQMKTVEPYFTGSRYLLFKLMKKHKAMIKANNYKLDMVFQRENHEFLFQDQFMQWIQGNSQMKPVVVYFKDHHYFLFKLMKKT